MAKASSRWKKADHAIAAQVAALADRMNGGYADLAVRLGISDRTLRTRRARPETFTLKELRRLTELAVQYDVPLLEVSAC